MDLVTVTSVRRASDRSDLVLADGEVFLGGGSWLFSEPQDGTSGLVDLTTMRWPAITATDAGLTIAATCTLAELAALPEQPGWRAHPLFFQCCTALLGSFKVWNIATVGGNIALSLPAGPMTSLAASLGADAVLWSPAGERRFAVGDLVTGSRSNLLEHGEVIRAIEIPTSSLAAHTAFRKIALSPLGRSGTVVIGRVDESGEFVLTITAGTSHPVQFAFDSVPTVGELAAKIDIVDCWYDDAHGAPDWREAMSRLFAEEIRTELSRAL